MPKANNYFDDAAKLQRIMSRTGSFPLTVVHDLLVRFAPKGAVVCDPFCGKGTTLLAARALHLDAYGIDVAPEAVICSAAKMTTIEPAALIEYIHHLPVRGGSPSEARPDVRLFFHPDTLRQLLAIRRRLLDDYQSASPDTRNCATFTLATLLGILHGHASHSISISSAHAFAMAPCYVRAYARDHHLKAPRRVVKDCLIKKALQCLPPRPLPRVRWAVKRGDAGDCLDLLPDLVGQVDIIITSPPYLDAQTYAKDNWLRHWLLGYDNALLRKAYLQTGSVDRYETTMSLVFRNLRESLKRDGLLICIAGDVRVGGPDREMYHTGRRLARLAAAGGFVIEQREVHRVPSLRRYYHALSATNGHIARALIERVFVARKSSP